ncbi:uncharacterized protein LOC7474562 isoform X7 [Populus trichocarpa]|uniref:uncharacterized protein LOC7474562 isoform X7 n=1 Tax=Populus trichocarpa TaxID=3694 RepID=UPI002277A581|nr:uncharacterized protein LOC7474562 isoform X7 [Populus trichocarpa]
MAFPIPRDHLDMRHRLDSKGQRKGKVDSKRYEWVRVDSWDNLSDKQEAKAYSKDLSSYCGRLLEETEDELAELIKKGSVKVGRLSKILCQDLSKHCKQSSDSHEVDADDDEPDGEL